MKKFFLMLIAITNISFIGNLHAEAWDCGKIANTVSCTLDDKGVFTVSGKGEMKDYKFGVDEDGQNPASSAPWGSGSRSEMRKIKSIVIEDGVTRIGENAFCGADKAVSVSMNSVVSIGKRGFYDLYSLQKAYMPNVETIESSAFAYNTNLKTLYAPKAKQIYNNAFYYTKRLEYAEINTKVSFSEAAFDQSNLSGCYGGICAKCEDKYILRRTGCVNKCPNSFKINDGECDRIRYTPAEAAEVLRDDNTNEVTITFKK